MVLQRNAQPNSPLQVNMVWMNHGGLYKAAHRHDSPPPYTFVAGDFNSPTKIGSNSAGFSPDPIKAALD